MDLAQFHGTLFGFQSTALSVVTFFSRISNFFDLSITEETSKVEMRIWCIKIVNVLVLHSKCRELEPNLSKDRTMHVGDNLLL
jgi:hypothetical protein